MRIGHWQLETTCGDFEGNLAKVVKGLERAERERVEIVYFPECFLTGYPDTEELARKHAFAADSPQVLKVLDRTARFDATFIVGFNERRGKDLKCFAYMPFHKQGRDFPVFEHGGVKFGVVICADGGYVEPSRILALKGAQKRHFQARAFQPANQGPSVGRSHGGRAARIDAPWAARPVTGTRESLPACRAKAGGNPEL
ncbi:MAG: carbon-nitrogen hydrolase family protein [Planctomycetes bacterium]|nr:carbon-nitrogen hydrolase family protein [Planctomycetota bacterium]